MSPSKTSELKAEVSELKTLVSDLLNKVNKVNKLTTENTFLREEIQHLKKLKGQPKIRPNKKNSDDGKDDKSTKPGSGSGNSPPKGKRPGSQPPGRTSKPSPSSVRDEICPAENVRGNWLSKGISGFYPC